MRKSQMPISVRTNNSIRASLFSEEPESDEKLELDGGVHVERGLPRRLRQRVSTPPNQKKQFAAFDFPVEDRAQRVHAPAPSASKRRRPHQPLAAQKLDHRRVVFCLVDAI
jgi:hypothetical protein